MRAHFYSFLFCCLLGLIVFSGRVYATSPVPPPAPAMTNVPESCDNEFYRVMHSKARMQGRRDNETAEHLILKPDSVLQYSCFDPAIINEAVATNIFVSDEYQNILQNLYGSTRPPAFTGTPYEDGMRAVVEVSSTAYLQGGASSPGNFNHAAGGGALSGALNYSPCYTMQAVWHELKCRNFDIDDFVTFAQIQANDRRIYPNLCNDANRGQDWQDLIDASTVPVVPAPAAAGEMDVLVPYLEIMTNVVLAGCGDPIPTGLLVGLNGAPDAVCPVPGCYYTGGACTIN